jgi:hypothetical protein
MKTVIDPHVPPLVARQCHEVADSIWVGMAELFFRNSVSHQMPRPRTWVDRPEAVAKARSSNTIEADHPREEV